MWTKLAMKNAARSIKDYAIYFITLAFSICVFYMFNSIYAQQAMIGLTGEMTDSIEAIQKILSYVSVFVAIVLGFLIVYANVFFIKRRKKEIGVYMTLGMEKRDISMILLMETSFIAILALVVGAALGVVLSQFMSVFTAKMFEADMTRFSFVFSLPALMKSILYFLVIFLIVIIFNISSISRYKLIDLLYANKKNETLKVQNTRIISALFVVSIVMIGIAYYLIIINGMMKIGSKFFTSILLGSIGTLLFFYSLSGIITTVLRANKRLYLKKLNMFVVRQLGSKINTNFVSISVVCIVLLLTIGIFATGYGMQKVLSDELKGYAGYDFSFYDLISKDEKNHESFGKLRVFLKNTNELKEEYTFPVYKANFDYSHFNVKLPKEASSFSDRKLECVSLSDYNSTMALQGKKPISLNNNEYAILTNRKIMTEYGNKILEKKFPITINKKGLYPVASLTGSLRNGFEQVVLVIPDEYVKGMFCNTYILNINCKDKDAAKRMGKHLAPYDNHSLNKTQGFGYYISRSKLWADAVEQKSTVSFISIYLGIVFMITCAAIMAIQQLTEAEDNKSRYQLLKKLGADPKMLNKALFVQILSYFIFPLLLAAVHSYFGLTAAINTLKIYGDINIISSGSVAVAFVVVLYTIYFLITYVGSKNIIERN